MQGIVSRLRDRIMAGGDLADGLAEFPNVFSSTFVTMVRAGEASGTLELVIERFAEHIEQQVALVRKVQATLAYPILMLFVGIGVVIFLLTFVIPKVTQIFSDMGRALPVPTQILLAVSDGIRSGWWIILLLVLCIMIGVWRMRRTEGGKRVCPPPAAAPARHCGHLPPADRRAYDPHPRYAPQKRRHPAQRPCISSNP